jgi:hypothetical protein
MTAIRRNGGARLTRRLEHGHEARQFDDRLWRRHRVEGDRRNRFGASPEAERIAVGGGRRGRGRKPAAQSIDLGVHFGHDRSDLREVVGRRDGRALGGWT